MEYIKSLSSDQIRAMPPSFWKTAFGYDELENDLFAMKHLFDTLDNVGILTYTNYLNDIRKLLLKYHNINFYVTPSLHNYSPSNGNSIWSITKWEIYIIGELQDILPTGIEINKISFSEGEKPWSYLDYPVIKWGYNGINLISELSKSYTNLKIIHPILLQSIRDIL